MADITRTTSQHVLVLQAYTPTPDNTRVTQTWQDVLYEVDPEVNFARVTALVKDVLYEIEPEENFTRVTQLMFDVLYIGEHGVLVTQQHIQALATIEEEPPEEGDAVQVTQQHIQVLQKTMPPPLDFEPGKCIWIPKRQIVLRIPPTRTGFCYPGGLSGPSPPGEDNNAEGGLQNLPVPVIEGTGTNAGPITPNFGEGGLTLPVPQLAGTAINAGISFFNFAAGNIPIPVPQLEGTGTNAGPAAPLLQDNFNRSGANLNTSSEGWTWSDLTAAIFTTNGAEAVHSGGGAIASARADLDVSGPGMYVEADSVGTLTAAQAAGLFVRLSDSAYSGYFTWLNRTTGQFDMYKVTAGSLSLLKNYGVPVLPGSTFRMRMEASGDLLRFLINDTAYASIIDSTFPSNLRVGIMGYNGNVIDNLDGGAFTAPAASSASDDFTRSDSSYIGQSAAGWRWSNQSINSYTQPWSIVSNEARSAAVAGNALARADIDLGSPDHFSEAVVEAITVTFGVCVRMAADLTTGYFVWKNAGNYEVYRLTDGIHTFLGSGSLTETAPFTLRLEISGSTLTVKANGSTKGTVVDATHATGNYTGIVANNQARVSSFSAGTL